MQGAKLWLKIESPPNNYAVHTYNNTVDIHKEHKDDNWLELAQLFH